MTRLRCTTHNSQVTTPQPTEPAEPGTAKPKRHPRPPYPARAVVTDPRRTGIWVGIGLAALVVLGVVLALNLDGAKALLGLPGAKHDIEGSIAITDPTGYSGDTDCAGDRAYSEIAEGTSVVVKDVVKGTTLSTGALSAGVEDVEDGLVDTCTFFFTLRDVPTDHMFYEIEVGHRRYPDISKALLMPEGWQVDLTADPPPAQRGTEPMENGRPRQPPVKAPPSALP